MRGGDARELSAIGFEISGLDEHFATRGVPVDRPKVVESTAAGAAFLAGLGVGLWKTARDVERARKPDRVFKPKMKARERDALYAGWQAAVERVRARPI